MEMNTMEYRSFRADPPYVRSGQTTTRRWSRRQGAARHLTPEREDSGTNALLSPTSLNQRLRRAGTASALPLAE
jgi:hypothetical protein